MCSTLLHFDAGTFVHVERANKKEKKKKKNDKLDPQDGEDGEDGTGKPAVPNEEEEVRI